MRLKLVVLLLPLFCLPVHAVQNAQKTHEADARIRTETYDPNRVYDVFTAIGRASLIQLEADESLLQSPGSVLGIGDSEAWNLGVRGNHIVLKPSQKMPRTNIVVATNKRVYTFDLRAAKTPANTTYVLKFYYPDSVAAKADAEAKAEAKRENLTSAAKAEKIAINTDYVWRGENEALKPTAAYDDGRFTRLVYDHAGELPLFFKVLPDGTEALLNSNVDPEDKSTVILHEVIRTARARLGDAVIEIVNKSYELPKLNTTGTSEHGTVRTERGAK